MQYTICGKNNLLVETRNKTVFSLVFIVCSFRVADVRARITKHGLHNATLLYGSLSKMEKFRKVKLKKK